MKRLWQNTLILALCFTSLLAPWAAEGNDGPEKTLLDKVFKEAAALYGQGKYDEAISRYEEILKKGYASGNLYYNLGNCYLKKGMPGKAVLFYERAGRLMPTDADLAANYDYARSFLRESPGETPKAGIYSLLLRLFRSFTTDGLTVLAFLLYHLIMTLLILRLFLHSRMYKHYTLPLIVLLMVLLLASLTVLSVRASLEGREAIVVTGTVDVRFEPFDKATVHYTLNEGTKVEIVQSTQEWYKIERADGKTGWVAKQNVEII